MKSLDIKLPLVLDVVEDEEMMETIRAGKHMIIAIPIEDIHTSGENYQDDGETCAGEVRSSTGST